LVYFALGAAVTGLIVLLSSWLYQPLVLDDDFTAVVVLIEPPNLETLSAGGVPSETDLIAHATGGLLKDCNASIFELTAMRADYSPRAEYPIVVENYGSLECVLNGLRNSKFEFTVENRFLPRTVREGRKGS